MGVIYYCKDFMDISAETIDELKKYLPLQRREKYEKYMFDKNKKECMLSYLLLRKCIFDEHDIDISGIDFAFGQYGKPYISELKHICFNISHSDNCVVCALSGIPVGVDVQNIQAAKEDICEMVLSDKENIIVFSNSSLAGSRFTMFWTLKEAYGKCIGKGLGVKFSGLDFSSLSKNGGCTDGLFLKSWNIGGSWIAICSERYDEWKLSKISVFDLIRNCHQ